MQKHKYNGAKVSDLHCIKIYKGKVFRTQSWVAHMLMLYTYILIKMLLKIKTMQKVIA